MSTTLPAERTNTPEAIFRAQLQKMDAQLKVALPVHIPVERFMRVIQTAAASNTELLDADRRSLFEAAMKAAQDGLLPDGRHGAFVTFNTKARDGSWVKKVQWMPMIAGILKKIRNSGELQSVCAHVVYSNDTFVYAMGDDERIEHMPAMGNRGEPVAAYAIAKTKDGGIYREVMTHAEIERVRSVSRAATKGPWVDWWDEMARKTALRRLSKWLPMSSDLDELMRRDDELYDFGNSDGALAAATRAFAPVVNPLSDAPEIEAPLERQLLVAPSTQDSSNAHLATTPGVEFIEAAALIPATSEPTRARTTETTKAKA